LFEAQKTMQGKLDKYFHSVIDALVKLSYIGNNPAYIKEKSK